MEFLDQALGLLLRSSTCIKFLFINLVKEIWQLFTILDDIKNELERDEAIESGTYIPSGYLFLFVLFLRIFLFSAILKLNKLGLIVYHQL